MNHIPTSFTKYDTLHTLLESTETKALYNRTRRGKLLGYDCYRILRHKKDITWPTGHISKAGPPSSPALSNGEHTHGAIEPSTAPSNATTLSHDLNRQ